MVLTTGWDTSTNKEIFKTLVKNCFNTSTRTAIVESEQMFKMLPGTDLYERDMRIAGMPRGTAIAEAGRIPIYDPKFDTTKDYTQAEYAAGFRVSWLFKKTEKWNIVQMLTENLSMNQKELKDVEMAKLWNSPTATYTGFDTQVLGYNTHTCLDDAASTYDNYLGQGLSYAALETARLYFERMKDDQGYTFFIRPDTFYYAPELMITVDEMFQSEKKAYSDENTTNVFKAMGLKLFPYHRLTATTPWGILAKNDRLFDVKCYTLSDPDIRVDDDAYNTRDSIVTSHQAFCWGFGDPRAVYIGNV